MSMLALLYKLGDRLGIIEPGPATNAARPAKIRTRAVTLETLTMEVHQKELQELAQLPAELSVGFDKVYETAGVPAPAHGWTVDRLIDRLLARPGGRDDHAAIQNEILSLLNSEKVPAEDIVRDAVARDQALDAFEVLVAQKMESRAASRERRLVDLEAQIGELRAKSERLRAESAREAEGWREWRRKKAEHEREMARAIGYLIDRPILTTETEE